MQIVVTVYADKTGAIPKKQIQLITESPMMLIDVMRLVDKKAGTGLTSELVHEGDAFGFVVVINHSLRDCHSFADTVVTDGDEIAIMPFPLIGG